MLLDLQVLTFSGHFSRLSAVYPSCVYRERWHVSTSSPSPAGMQSKGEMEGEKWHTCRAHKPLQVLKDDQRSEMSSSRWSAQTSPLLTDACSTCSVLLCICLTRSRRKTSAESSPLIWNRCTCAESCGSDRSTSMFSPVWTFFSSGKQSLSSPERLGLFGEALITRPIPSVQPTFENTRACLSICYFVAIFL